MTFSIKTFSIFLLSELKRKAHLKAAPEHSCTVFLESFGNLLGVPMERFDLCRKYWPQAEDPTGTIGIWEAKCSLPANLRAAK